MRPLLAFALLALPAAAAAHNPWIKPSATSVAGQDNWVTFDAASSTDPFVADHQPMRLEAIHAFAPDGGEAKIENAMVGRYRATFDLHLTQQGTYRVAVTNGGITGSYMLGGETHRVGGRGGAIGMRPGGGPGEQRPGGGGEQRPPMRFESGGPDFALPAGATEVKLSETMSRDEVFVTLGKPSPIATSGKGLELQPISHPDDLVTGEPARFRLLIDGKPAPGIAATIIADGRRYRDAPGEIALKSDDKGEILVRWPAPGLYWFNASATDAHTANRAATQRRLSYVATLEVMAP